MTLRLFLLLSFITLPFVSCNQEDLSSAAAQSGLQVGIFVSPEDGTETKKFISVDAESLTGFEALSATGLEIISSTSAFGVGICSVDGVGHPENNCFGAITDPSWAFFVRASDGTWNYSDVGANLYQVSDGDVLGFVYTTYDENFDPIRVPAAVSLEDFTD